MVLKLDRLSASIAIVDGQNRPAPQFQLLIQNAWKSLEVAFNGLEQAVVAIQEAQAAADAANQAAENAQNAADAAQTAADSADAAAGGAQDAAEATAAASALATSGVTGLTMEALDAGADARIDISAHTRVYGDGSTVAVSAGAIATLAYDTIYYVFYHDAGRAGGAVTYQASTNSADAAQTGDTHSLGTVKTPLAAGAPTPAIPNPPPGVQDWK